MKYRFQEEGIDLETYDPNETQAIVRSLSRHVTNPKQKKNEGDKELDDNQKLADTLLKLAGQ